MNPPSLRAVRVGVLLLIVTEIMYFGGLISSFWVFRYSLLEWPPPGQPRYPVSATLINTFFLLASGVTNHLYRIRPRTVWLLLTGALGTVFLLLQGMEWVRLVAFGMTMTSSVYGAIFYLIVGSHAVHVVAGLLWWAVASWRRSPGALEGAGLFWYFVVFVWPVLYITVYLLPNRI